MESFVFTCGDLAIHFSPASGGLPEAITVTEFGGARHRLATGSRLELELTDGRIGHPVVAVEPEIHAGGIEFPRLDWVDQYGAPIPDLHLSLSHAFHPDGTAFTEGFWLAESIRPPRVCRFELIQELEFRADAALRWCLLHRPRQHAGEAIIELDAPDRFLPRGENRSVAQGIFPLASFYERRSGAPSLYAEFFVEGDNTISGCREDNCSSVVWSGNHATLRWNFQNCPEQRPRGTIRQWRNCWGWSIAVPESTRHLPPMTMYHMLGVDCYASEEQLAALQHAGCQVLVLHETWRLDLQNGGQPQNPERLRAIIAQAHRLGMRVALYMRGNERSVIEGGPAWFERWLQRDRDGLYADYGGPFCRVSAPDENDCNGRVNFRKHYLTMRQLRETVGPDGLLYAHTGPWFSAVGQRFTTGYVSGEGERGAMIASREAHEYYSMAAVHTGTMWTAAFPEYSSPAMVPFLAATGQYPHSPLGVQFTSSSLAHPDFPGFNDRNFRQLWNIWSCFADERDITVFHDSNSAGVFPCDPDTGHYLMISANRRRALLIVANFRTEPVRRDVAPQWRLTGFQPCNPGPYTFLLGIQGLAARLWEADGSVRELPAPPEPAGDQQYRKLLEEQRFRRENPPPWRHIALRVELPDTGSKPFEDSLVLDLFNNRLELLAAATANEWHSLGWIDRNGWCDAASQEILMPGDITPALALEERLLPGRHRLKLRSTHGGAPFYSFVRLELSNGAESYRLEFLNELESDRSELNFQVNLTPGKKQESACN